MTTPRVYVETTIPSFYHETRTTPEIVARRDWTRRWWDGAGERYELVTSPAVLDELAQGPPNRAGGWLSLLAGLPVLTVDASIAEIAGRQTMKNDEPIDEIREVRRRISARFEHDPAKLVAYYMKLQEQYRDRLIDTGKTSEAKDQSAA
jgi:hypothetical protein